MKRLVWVNCWACGGSGEIIRAGQSRDPADEYAELCKECDGTGRECVDEDEKL
jgi:DnaJ-class molecular chaperone